MVKRVRVPALALILIQENVGREECHGVTVTKIQHFTSPPKQYTEDTLLSAMETAGNEDFDEDTEKKGLGTPATRASVIEKLVSSKYLERKGKQLIPTDAGINLVAVLPEKVKSAKMTAEWENALMEIDKGQWMMFIDKKSLEKVEASMMEKAASKQEKTKAIEIE